MVTDSYLYTLANTTTATTPIAAYTPNVDRLEAKMKELESLFFRKVVVNALPVGSGVRLYVNVNIVDTQLIWEKCQAAYKPLQKKNYGQLMLLENITVKK